VWDWGKKQTVLDAPGAHRILPAFSPDSRQAAVGFGDGSVRLYELPSAKEGKRLWPALPAGPFAVDGPAGMICFNPGGDQLAVCNGPGRRVQIFRVDTGQRLAAFTHPQGWLEVLAWHPDGRSFATACGNAIYFLDGKTLQQRRVIGASTTRVTQLAFSPKGEVLLSNGYDNTLRLWDALSGRQRAVYPDASNPGRLPNLSWHERYLPRLKGTRVGICEVALGRECRRLQGNAFPTFAFSPDGRLLAFTVPDGVKLCDPVDGTEIALLPLQGIKSLRFDPVHGDLITGGPDGVHRWPLVAQAAAWRLGPSRQMPLGGLGMRDAFSLSGNGEALVARAGSDRAAVLRWRYPTKPILLHPHPQLWTVAVSPDGKWVATGPWNGAGVRIWDAATGKRVRDLPGSEKYPSATVTFSPDGRWLVTGTNRDYRFWRVPQGTGQAEPDAWQPGLTIGRTDGAGLPGRMAFSPDGTLLAAQYSGSGVKLRDPRTGAEFATLETPGAQLLAGLFFSADGSQLAVADEPGSIFLWDLRLIRQQLAPMGLDWDLPAYPPAPEASGPPLQLQVDLGALKVLAQVRQHLQQGQTHAQARQWGKAVAAYSKALELRPDHVEAWANRGLAHSELGEQNRAVADYSKALELDPKSSWVWNNRGTSYSRLGQWDRALADYSKALALSSEDGMARRNRAWIYLKLRQWDKAADDYSKVLEREPGNAVCWNFRAVAYQQQGQAGKAAADFAQAQALAGQQAEIWFTLGQIRDSFRHWREGIVCYSKVIELQPDRAEAWYERGASFAILKDHARALPDLSKAIELQPRNWLYRRERGNLYAALGSWDKAAVDFARAAELRPGDAWIHHALGMALNRQGRHADAIAAFRKAVALKPDLAAVIGSLADLLTDCPDPKLRDPAGALELRRKLVKLAPRDAWAWQNLGWALCRSAAWKEGITALEKSMALQQSPKGGDSGQWFGLAVCHAKLGNPAEARKWYDRAVAWMEKHAPRHELFRHFRAEAAAVLKIEGGTGPK
jgi:tetratricopeptide (TPR) repeat protein/WD40 repeat protein